MTLSLANPSSALFLNAGAKEQRGVLTKGGMWRNRRELLESSETRRPSVKEMREGGEPRFGSGSVTREGEIKV